MQIAEVDLGGQGYPMGVVSHGEGFCEQKEREKLGKSFGVDGHFYQPPRFTLVPDGILPDVNGEPQNILLMAPEWNEIIYGQSYRPNLVLREDTDFDVDNADIALYLSIHEADPFPEGFHFSLYPTMREWMKWQHPEEFKRVQERVARTADKEYQVFCDPFGHWIMPLLQDRKDKDMAVKMGKMAFFEDFGFVPKGMWLPETAVNTETLEVLSENGIEFAVLRDSQLQRSDRNPMYVLLTSGKLFPIIHFHSELSGTVSFDQWPTMNADNFMVWWLLPRMENTNDLQIGSDGELYGHHQEGRANFRKAVLQKDRLHTYGLEPFSIREKLDASRGREEEYEVALVENSSWSDENGHNLGRWKGECCGNTTEKLRNFFAKLTAYNAAINKRLDQKNAQWRGRFAKLAVSVRQKLFTGQNFLEDLQAQTHDEEEYIYFIAKLYTMIGFTSCPWFFPEENPPRIEPTIPETMIKVVERLIPDLVNGFATREPKEIQVFPQAA